jgi:DNA-binding FadR family transcriptional regulator
MLTILNDEHEIVAQAHATPENLVAWVDRVSNWSFKKHDYPIYIWNREVLNVHRATMQKARELSEPLAQRLAFAKAKIEDVENLLTAHEKMEFRARVGFSEFVDELAIAKITKIGEANN